MDGGKRLRRVCAWILGLMLCIGTQGRSETGNAAVTEQTAPAVAEEDGNPGWGLSAPFEGRRLKQFQIPIPEGWTVQINRARDQIRGVDPEGKYMLQASVSDLQGVFFARETWNDLYPELLRQLEARMYHPVAVDGEQMGILFPDTLEVREGELQEDHRLRLAYGYGPHLLLMDLVSRDEPLDPKAMDGIFQEIHYRASEGEAVYADYQMKVSAPEGRRVLSAGESMRFQASFANPETVNRGRQNDGVQWRVMVKEEELTDAFSIRQDGTLTVSKEIEAPTWIAVVAISREAGTQDLLEMRVLPQIQELLLEPGECTLILGRTESAELQARIEPETASRMLEWRTSDSEVVTVETAEDGRAVIRAAAPGDARITAEEKVSGKKAQVQVKVIRPVTEITISGPEKIKIGWSVYYRAEVQPADATDRQVKWSIDADADTAEISSDGNLVIRRSAKPGTVITLRCEALGNGEGLTAEYQVTVTE